MMASIPVRALRHRRSTAPSDPACAALFRRGHGRHRCERAPRARRAVECRRPLRAEARVAFDDGWQSLEDLPAFKTTVTVDTRAVITRNDSPDISLRPFDQSLSRLRARLHLLLRTPDPCLSRSVARRRFRIQAVREAERAELLERELSAPTTSPRTIAIGTNTDPYQPIEKQYRVMRRHSRSARPVRSSGRHRHQVGAGAARSRYSGAYGRAQPRQGRAVGDHARSEAGTRDGASRRDTGAPA